MRKTEGWAWPIQVGFHANESMRLVLWYSGVASRAGPKAALLTLARIADMSICTHVTPDRSLCEYHLLIFVSACR